MGERFSSETLLESTLSFLGMSKDILRDDSIAGRGAALRERRTSYVSYGTAA